MISAFGVDHGEISKGFNPIKGVQAAGRAVKARGKLAVDRSAAKNFQRGHNQGARSRGVAIGGHEVSPTVGSMMPGFKRSHAAYAQGQQAGARAAHSYKNPLPDPFR